MCTFREALIQSRSGSRNLDPVALDRVRNPNSIGYSDDTPFVSKNLSYLLIFVAFVLVLTFLCLESHDFLLYRHTWVILCMHLHTLRQQTGQLGQMTPLRL